MSSEQKVLIRDVEASVVPIGTKVTLQKGEPRTSRSRWAALIPSSSTATCSASNPKTPTRSGFKCRSAPASTTVTGGPLTREELEKKVWESLKTCYDPEIPVNIVDLGLIYDCHLTPAGESSFKADVKMTLTAPGCGMGPVLAQDVQNKLLSLEPIDEANVELVWDPPWNQGMMTEAAKLQLGLL